MRFKRIITSISIILLVFLFVSLIVPNTSKALGLFEDDRSDIEKTIDKDDGGLFEKIIAKMIRRTCRNSI